MSNSSTLVPMPEAYIQEYNGSTVISVATSFMVLETVVVVLRFIARWTGKIKLAADDYLILPALACCIAINAVAIAMVQYAGVGHHFEVILSSDPTKLILWAKFLIVQSCLYLVAVILPKLAILAIYWRVFPTKPVRLISILLAAFMVIGSVIGLIFAGISCIPLNAFWDSSIEGSHCFDIHALFSWASFPNLISDLAILILPLPLIWQLRIANQVKLGLTITFLTGSIGLAASVLRFQSFWTIDPRADGTWASVPLLTWTVVEPGAYLIAACLPTLRPLVMKFWHSSRATILRSDATKRASGTRLAVEVASVEAVAETANVEVTPTAANKEAGIVVVRHTEMYFEIAKGGEPSSDSEIERESRDEKSFECDGKVMQLGDVV